MFAPRRLIATGAVLSATVLIAAGCGGGDSSGMSSAAKYTPADAALLMQVDTNANNPGWGELRSMLENWTDIREAIAQIEDNGTAREARALLGSPMVIAAVQEKPTKKPSPAGIPDDLGAALNGAGQMQAVLSLETPDNVAAARANFIKNLGKPDLTIQGASAWREGGMVIAAPAGAIVAASNSKAMEVALSGKGPSPDLAATLLAQPDGALMRGSVLPGAIADGVPTAAAVAGAVQTGPFGFSANATARAVSISATAPDDTPLQGTAFAPSLWKDLPESTSAYVGFANLAGLVRDAISQARTDGDAGDALAQVGALGPAALGVGWEDLIRITTKEHALVAGGAKGAAWGALVLQVDDPARARETLDAAARGIIKNLAGQLSDTPLTAVDVTLGAVKLRGVKVDGDTWVTWGLRGDNAVVAVGEKAGLADFYRAGNPPASLAQAMGTLPDEVTNVAWIDAPGAAAALGASDAYLRQVKGGLASVVGWSSGREGELELMRP